MMIFGSLFLALKNIVDSMWFFPFHTERTVFFFHFLVKEPHLCRDFRHTWHSCFSKYHLILYQVMTRMDFQNNIRFLVSRLDRC